MKGLLTNGLNSFFEIIDIFFKINNEIKKQKSFSENIEKFLDFVFSYRKKIFQIIEPEESTFFSFFSKEYKIKVKHDGTYLISYLTSKVKILEECLKNVVESNNSEYLLTYLKEIRSKINSVSERHPLISYNEGKNLDMQIDETDSFSYLKRHLKKKNQKNVTNTVDLKIVKNHIYKVDNMIKKLRHKSAHLKAPFSSSILSLRKMIVLLHLFSLELKFEEDNIQVFCDIFGFLFLETMIKFDE